MSLVRADLQILTAPEWRGRFRDLEKKGATPNEAASELAGGFALRKDFTGPFIKAPDSESESKLYTFVFSNETVDRDWDKIRLAGWGTSNYKLNPTVLWSHDGYSLPIGRTKKLRKEDGELVGDILFTPADINPMGGVVAAMLDHKPPFLNAGSVGFLPIEVERPGEDEEDRRARYGINFVKQELLEYSIVTVPSNPTALRRALDTLSEKDAALWLAHAHAAGINTDPWRKWAERVLERSIKGLAISDLQEASDALEKSGRTVVQVLRSDSGELVQVPAADPVERDDAKPLEVTAPTPEDPTETRTPELTFLRDSSGAYVACVDGQAKVRVEDPDSVELDDDGILVLRGISVAPIDPAPATRAAPSMEQIIAATRAAVDQALKAQR